MQQSSLIPLATDIYRLKGDRDIVFPGSLEEAFVEFVSNSGMPFAPQVSREDANVRIHFLFLSKSLQELADEFLATIIPDDYHTIELAVINDRTKHAIRIAEESNWIPFIRQAGTERTRICFIRTPRSIPTADLQERIELVA